MTVNPLLSNNLIPPDLTNLNELDGEIKSLQLNTNNEMISTANELHNVPRQNFYRVFAAQVKPTRTH